ncbi:MAG: hypothetical protein AB7H80_13295 [Candidatus Kapaibacterium sp.]
MIEQDVGVRCDMSVIDRLLGYNLWVLIPLLLSACSTGTHTAQFSKDSAIADYPNVDQTTAQPTITLLEADQLVTSLEQDPLSADAPAQRMVLTAWVVASPEVGELVPDDKYVGDIFSSDHPYSSELFMQYMFGIALAQAKKNDSSARSEHIEAGIRSMLAAYKSLVAADESLRDRFLDELDRFRQLGKLASYIESVNAQQRD